MISVTSTLLTSCRELLLLVVVTAATEQKHLNGAEAPTEQEPCVMLAGYVSATIIPVNV